jgi:threonine/homoserine/homoserine lactone efflux protein
MIATIVSSPTFAAFISASVILAITPGPGVLYIVTRTLSQGRMAGLGVYAAFGNPRSAK